MNIFKFNILFAWCVVIPIIVSGKLHHRKLRNRCTFLFHPFEQPNHRQFDNAATWEPVNLDESPEDKKAFDSMFHDIWMRGPENPLDPTGYYTTIQVQNASRINYQGNFYSILLSANTSSSSQPQIYEVRVYQPVGTTTFYPFAVNNKTELLVLRPERAYWVRLGENYQEPGFGVMSTTSNEAKSAFEAAQIFLQNHYPFTRGANLTNLKLIAAGSTDADASVNVGQLFNLTVTATDSRNFTTVYDGIWGKYYDTAIFNDTLMPEGEYYYAYPIAFEKRPKESNGTRVNLLLFEDLDREACLPIPNKWGTLLTIPRFQICDPLFPNNKSYTTDPVILKSMEASKAELKNLLGADKDFTVALKEAAQLDAFPNNTTSPAFSLVKLLLRVTPKDGSTTGYFTSIVNSTAGYIVESISPTQQLYRPNAKEIYFPGNNPANNAGSLLVPSMLRSILYGYCVIYMLMV